MLGFLVARLTASLPERREWKLTATDDATVAKISRIVETEFDKDIKERSRDIELIEVRGSRLLLPPTHSIAGAACSRLSLIGEACQLRGIHYRCSPSPRLFFEIWNARQTHQGHEGAPTLNRVLVRMYRGFLPCLHRYFSNLWLSILTCCSLQRLHMIYLLGHPMACTSSASESCHC